MIKILKKLYPDGTFGYGTVGASSEINHESPTIVEEIVIESDKEALRFLNQPDKYELVVTDGKGVVKLKNAKS